MSEQSEAEKAKVILRKNGDLTIIDSEGKDHAVANYNEKTGHLEFASKEESVKYYNQVVARIGTEGKGTEISGRTIRSFGVKGEKRADLKTVPKRPKMGPLGDSAEDIVAWFLAYDLPQAIVRYGLYLDDNGQPVRKKVRRVLENTVDNRELDDVDLQAVKDGRSSTVKAPVNREYGVVEKSDGYIARRATALTFTPSEVVGGWQPDQEFEDAQVGGEDEL